ncbi:alpha-1,3/1,6-mannosyltransferase ALG2-like isoform X2 [Amphibalanus amphitrite]|uniref:alpha-1,3/1,6-mannosyltransferase ALG2-like isoform X2 n=1 Tax=Amphibalanus amphitrite TaxID=1232801 RepID=UPI001C923C07|nr:alpha-1,3/1,6-mannosyltransferase ALG2-like isoform X2 [Amphibalanus amphitrite]XP_043228203.1 alpha-1,3/1,6-mannosyltransferase ALG2-like isoform X2 [Amphibalanus amphitrite]
MRVLFLHPDLGIGGAERLVVDAGLALQRRGHQVSYVTAHHDRQHCFPETRDQLPVTVRVAWLPGSVCGRLRALCVYVRMLYAALCVVLAPGPRPDLVFCDQVSACVPLLRWAGLRVLFYCHFPDQLLTARRSALKRLYRAPLDWLEERSTGAAHRVLVNSAFTGGVFAETFPSLRAGRQPDVLYPSLDLAAFDAPLETTVEQVLGAPPPPHLLLSLNRFERKKNLALALDALAEMERLDAAAVSRCHLVLAGGYDPQNAENIAHLAELEAHAAELGVSERVTFLRSPSDAAKRALLRAATAVVYTPDREHFGIVPLEAMYCGAPVVAAASGGPLETVVSGQTGLLCEPRAQEFAAALLRLVTEPETARRMGEAGRRRVLENFSFQAFGDRLEKIVTEVVAETAGKEGDLGTEKKTE